ncbi:hypothetical protein CAEBREN_28607 [Caenorhabditis brenneri]|uniref:3-beta hydroxysteroid dehydrogenase/isomerase domain-containing protein n=1 Tax=Caenorhabditis brenneri TaxID=135651 RepID=G0M8E1_CAEBE|nr:hypothetical protein CAEBREN_28607 [Caenorhabditis brenneri]
MITEAVHMTTVFLGRYVIVGGGGFLGAKVIEGLRSSGFVGEITVVDPNPQVFKTIDFDPSQVNYIEGSFLDNKVLDKALKGADAVFHLASVGHTGLVAGNRDYVFKFNVEGTKNLIKKCKEHRVARFLYASSVAVSFVGIPLTNASEDDPLPAPEKYLDYYSASKALAEQYVLSQSTEKFKTVCLRFRAIYGPEDPNVTHKVAKLIKRGLFVGMVSIHGRESNSNASSGANCAKAFVLADTMLKNPEGLHGRVYYIMDQETVGQYAFWEPLVLALGRTPPSRFISYELMRFIVPHIENVCYLLLKTPPLLTKFELSILATDNTYSIERARRELGYEPEPCVMSEVAEYYKNLEEELVSSTVDDWKLIIAVFIAIAAILLAYFVSF